MCLYPKVILNRKYVANKKNGGQVPPVLDERTKYVPVGCGSCIECRKKKAREWQVRLLEDVKGNKDGTFVTLTFRDEQIRYIAQGRDTDGNEIIERKTKEPIGSIKLEGYALDNEIATVAVRRFLERWRKEYGKSVRHWLVTELGGGGTENIHLHGIMWIGKDGDGKQISMEALSSIWKYGYVWPNDKQRKGNYVNEATVNYVTKYVSKIDEKHKGYNSKILTSSGMGYRYTRENTDSKNNKYKETGRTNETYRTRTGDKITMPVYWRNAIYSEEEREKLWIQKLDKEERWVMGKRIDISKGEEIYFRVLQEAQRINKNLGYGDDQKDWTKIQYEKERRNIKIKERIAKGEWKNNNKK